MKRTFLTNLVLLLVLNLLVKPFYILGIDAGVQQAVGSEAYGGYAALMSLSFLLNIVLDLGITNYNTRNVARHGHLMAKYLGGIAVVRLLLLVAYLVLTMVAGIALGYRGDRLGMLGWLAVNQGLAAGILYLRGNIAGAQHYRWDSLLSVLDRALLILVVGWLLWGRPSGVEGFRMEWFVWAQTLAYAFTFVVALSLTLRISGRVRWQWKPAFGMLVVRRSMPYALLILLMTFYYRTDTLMLERLLPEGALHAGIYAQGFRFFEASNMLGFLVAGLLLPMFSRQIKAGEDVAPLADLGFRLVLAASVSLAVIASLEPRAVMDLRYTEHTERSAPAFAVLMWCFTAVCTTYVFGTLLTAAGELRALNRMAAAGVVVNVGLNVLLIPRWQAEGAAWASLVTQAGTAAVQMAIARRKFRLERIARPLVRAAVHAVLLGAVVALPGAFGAPASWGLVAGIILAPLHGRSTRGLACAHAGPLRREVILTDPFRYIWRSSAASAHVRSFHGTSHTVVRPGGPPLGAQAFHPGSHPAGAPHGCGDLVGGSTALSQRGDHVPGDHQLGIALVAQRAGHRPGRHPGLGR
jgi:O-antigen/teichoic acid export membrane protein